MFRMVPNRVLTRPNTEKAIYAALLTEDEQEDLSEAKPFEVILARMPDRKVIGWPYPEFNWEGGTTSRCREITGKYNIGFFFIENESDRQNEFSLSFRPKSVIEFLPNR